MNNLEETFKKENIPIYISYSKLISQHNEKISLLINSFIIEKLDRNDTLFSKVSKQIESQRNKLKIKKETKLSEICSYDDYVNFISKVFENLDKEEKKGDISLETATVFKMLCDLISLIQIWKPLEEDDEWVNMRKYCKFKAILIYNKLNGITQDELFKNKITEDKEVDQELNQMIKEVETERKSSVSSSITPKDNTTQVFEDINKISSYDDSSLLPKNEENENKEKPDDNYSKHRSMTMTNQSNPMSKSMVLDNKNVNTPITNIDGNKQSIQTGSGATQQQNKGYDGFIHNMKNSVVNNYSHNNNNFKLSNSVIMNTNTTSNTNQRVGGNNSMPNYNMNMIRNVNNTSTQNLNMNLSNISNYLLGYNQSNVQINKGLNQPTSSNIQPVRKIKKEEQDYLDLVKAISDLKSNKKPSLDLPALSKSPNKDTPQIKDNSKNLDQSKKPNIENRPNTTKLQININTSNSISSNQQIKPNQSKTILPLQSPMINNSNFSKLNSNLKFPVKLRSPEYFNLVNTIKKSLNSGIKDIESNKIDKSLEGMENILYLLTKIE